MAETLLTPSGVKLYGRIVADLMTYAQARYIASTIADVTEAKLDAKFQN